MNTANLDLIRSWTGQVLSFAMENAARPGPLAPADAAVLDGLIQRATKLLAGSGKERLVLAGLGSGALLKRLAQALPDTALLCLEPDPERARPWLAAPGNALPDTAALLADGSPWALACLAERCGFGPDQAVSLLNPEPIGPKPIGPEGERVRETQRLLARLRPASAAQGTPGSLADLSCAAILCPDEPDLEGFVAQFPPGIRELVLVWDSEAIPDLASNLAPDMAPDAPFPIRHLAHPLDKDFAAQRNRMLAACTGDWVLSLDADERLAPGLWEHLPGLMRADWAGVLLPRLTLFPDADHFRMGFGLWPDLQLRLFRHAPGLRYVRPIHERLEGLDGPLALLPDRPILHLTHLAKRPQAIQDKLAGFNEIWAASGGALRHTLNQDFPFLDAAPPFLPVHPAETPRVLLPGRQQSSPVAPGGEGV